MSLEDVLQEVINPPDPDAPPPEAGPGSPVPDDLGDPGELASEDDTSGSSPRQRRRQERAAFDPVERINGIDIPAGARLVKISDPSGSDAGAIYVLRYNLFGIEVGFEVGNFQDAQSMFGDNFAEAFDGFQRMTQEQFDQSDIILNGSVDQIAGSTESLGSQFEREIRALGLEGVPDWIANDPSSMAIMVIAGQQGWSTQRIGNELQGTEAFKQRFPGFEGLSEALGTDDVFGVIDQYTTYERQLRQVLRRYRGGNTDVSTEYLGSLIGAGWQPTEVEGLVIAERDLKDHPDALDNINEMLAFAGLAPLDPDGFLDVIQGNAPPDVFAVLNDAFRLTALEEQGLTFDAAFIASLGGGTENQLQSVEGFTGLAVTTAATIAANRTALDAERFGLSREAITAAIFNDPDALPDGMTVAQVNETLARINRENLAGQQGLGAPPSFINQRSRLIIQGLGPTS